MQAITLSRRTLLVFACVFAVKLAVGFWFYDFESINSDEEVNYDTAKNYLAGKGYVADVFGMGNTRPTAYHPSGTIFLYEALIKLGVSMSAWSKIYFVLSNALFLLSLYYFFGLAMLFTNEKLALAATACYGLYPSVLYFLGATSFYENITMYFLLAVVYCLLVWMRSRNVMPAQLGAVAFIIVLSCWLRIVLVPVYTFILAAYVAILLWKKIRVRRIVTFTMVLVVTFVASQAPILLKNHAIFGHYIFSTQSGYELMQGHSAISKGSWNGGALNTQSDYYRYSHRVIPNLDSLNEYDESEARKKIAMDWMRQRPLDELKLELRKLVVFFLPYNNADRLKGYGFNPVNLFFHLGFFFFVALLFVKGWYRDERLLIIVLPVIGVVLTSLLLFVYYRSRFYAEPFFVLATFVVIDKLLAKERKDAIPTRQEMDASQRLA